MYNLDYLYLLVFEYLVTHFLDDVHKKKAQEEAVMPIVNQISKQSPKSLSSCIISSMVHSLHSKLLYPSLGIIPDILKSTSLDKSNKNERGFRLKPSKQRARKKKTCFF